MISTYLDFNKTKIQLMLLAVSDVRFSQELKRSKCLIGEKVKAELDLFYKIVLLSLHGANLDCFWLEMGINLEFYTSLESEIENLKMWKSASKRPD